MPRYKGSRQGDKVKVKRQDPQVEKGFRSGKKIRFEDQSTITREREKVLPRLHENFTREKSRITGPKVAGQTRALGDFEANKGREVERSRIQREVRTHERRLERMPQRMGPEPRRPRRPLVTPTTPANPQRT